MKKIVIIVFSLLLLAGCSKEVDSIRYAKYQEEEVIVENILAEALEEENIITEVYID